MIRMTELMFQAGVRDFWAVFSLEISELINL